MKRTIRVQEIKDKINRLLESPELEKKEKRALCTFLEGILFQTENYKGYSNIYWAERGHKKWVEDGKPDDMEPYLGPKYDRYYY